MEITRYFCCYFCYYVLLLWKVFSWKSKFDNFQPWLSKGGDFCSGPVLIDLGVLVGFIEIRLSYEGTCKDVSHYDGCGSSKIWFQGTSFFWIYGSIGEVICNQKMIFLRNLNVEYILYLKSYLIPLSGKD